MLEEDPRRMETRGFVALHKPCISFHEGPEV